MRCIGIALLLQSDARMDRTFKAGVRENFVSVLSRLCFGCCCVFVCACVPNMTGPAHQLMLSACALPANQLTADVRVPAGSLLLTVFK